MNLSTISSFKQEQKINARLGVIDIKVYSSSGGERTVLVLKDEEGSQIECVGFQDVRHICQQLKVGKTYVFNDVISSTYNDKKQLKLTSFSSVHISSLKIQTTQSLSEVIQMPVDSFASVIAVVSVWSENTSINPRSNVVSRRIQISDPTCEHEIVLFKEASRIILKKGDIVSLRVKIGANSSIVCFNSPEVIEDEELDEWWTEHGSKDNKRIKSTKFTKIGAINSQMIGNRIDVEAVISSVSINTNTTQSGMKKRVMEIVDDSCTSIEVTIFGESAEANFKIGEKICISASVSDWNGLSLVVNALLNYCEDTPINRFSSLQEWWKQEGSYATIKSHTSMFSDDIITLEEAIKTDKERVSLKGNIMDGIFTDNTHSVPLECHSSYNFDLSNLDGPVMLRNALICKSPPKIVVFRSTIKMMNTDQPTITSMLGKDVSIILSNE
tara:strand:- start:597 stop:1922 length:1326 start_codon:yes stop_codon:yes gene_type:complete